MLRFPASPPETKPVITNAFISREQGRYKDALKIYIEADDPEGFMDRRGYKDPFSNRMVSCFHKLSEYWIQAYGFSIRNSENGVRKGEISKEEFEQKNKDLSYE